MNSETFWFIFVCFIVFIKILFVLFAVLEKYYKYKNEENTPNSKWAIYWKERLEFIFIICMSFLCIILFYPFTKKPLVIDKDVRLLIFVYGIVILMTANWHLFIDNLPPWVKYVQSYLSLLHLHS